MKKVTTAVLLTLGLGTALFACPAGGFEKRGGEYRNGMKNIMKQLDLSSEQREQMQTLRESRKDVMKAKRKECKENRKAMQQQMRPDMSKFMTANTFDKDAFKQEMKKKHEARRAKREKRKEAMLDNRADSMEKMFKILTPEQRTKWIELSKNQKNNNCKS
ncbi:periplasmic heavy metal sensor [Sulfurovum sp.]|uniref:Spy/CpxP family protein refolding chaperone n=1 Tax=Sulfurovum sp. TaxID=1969726 RepID=UPI00286820A7|nr:periplasmic heavy metal sensor [Sulfurovum sp.]